MKINSVDINDSKSGRALDRITERSLNHKTYKQHKGVRKASKNAALEKMKEARGRISKTKGYGEK
jgi:hypothetical protein